MQPRGRARRCRVAVAGHNGVVGLAGAVLLVQMLYGQSTRPAPGTSAAVPQAAATAWDQRDRDIAAHFAPVFYQGVMGTSRLDYITSFDFDGDWKGDNNWKNAGDPKFPLNAYVYYAVSETPTHYLIHYAAFHPRDYKGGQVTGSVLSQVVRRGASSSERIKRLPVANDVVLAHENDLEGCLVVAEKRGPRLDDAEVTLVETLAHNRYLKFQRDSTLAKDVGRLRLEGQHALIYIEPKGHGMEAYDDQDRPPAPAPAASPSRASDATPTGTGGTGLVDRVTGLVNGFNKARKVVNLEGAESIRIYRFAGKPEDPERVSGDVGYDLVPTYGTWWARARTGVNETYGEAQDYGTREVRVATPSGKPTTRAVKLGRLGSAILGLEGAANKARPPWGWFDMTERDRPLGEWFFDPAAVISRHVPDAKISAAYVHHPFLGVIRATGEK
mgnify:CR=1 FL=1